MKTSPAEKVVSYIVLIFFALQSLIPILYVLFLSLSSEKINDSSWGHIENFAKEPG